jgi:transglutaminase-like putative cysteine protease
VFRIPVFDVTMLDVATAEVQVLGREKLELDGRKYDAVKYTTKLSKITMTTWVDADGLVLREESPPKMRSERAEMKDVLANETGDSQVDVLRIFSVPVDTVIQEPELVRRAKVQLSGIEAGEYEFASDNQKVVTEKPLVLEITSPEPPSTPVPLPVKGGEEFLKPTVSIQCDDAGIKRQAAAEVGKLTDAVEATRKLVSWVFTAMDKQATASFPTAVDVLAGMKGDCNEHSVLLAALCRASGIPTKVVVGLVYLNGAFYYHAWNEVLLDRWVPVDATFGEFPAGALRVRLAEGEISKQAEILGLVGRLQIKILEYSR